MLPAISMDQTKVELDESISDDACRVNDFRSDVDSDAPECGSLFLCASRPSTVENISVNQLTSPASRSDSAQHDGRNCCGCPFQGNLLSCLKSLDMKLELLRSEAEKIYAIEGKVDDILKILNSRPASGNSWIEASASPSSSSAERGGSIVSSASAELNQKVARPRLGSLMKSVTELSSIATSSCKNVSDLLEGSLHDVMHIPEETLDELQRCSVSRGNFAKNLTMMVFSRQELERSNCNGRVFGKFPSKKRLDVVKLDTVRRATFKRYPCQPALEDKIWRRECVLAIDKALRNRDWRARRASRKNITSTLAG